MADSAVPDDVELTNYQAVRSIVAAHGAELPPQETIVALLAEQIGGADENVGDTSIGSSGSSSGKASSTSGSIGAAGGVGAGAVVLDVGKEVIPFRVLALSDGPSSRIVYRVEWERGPDGAGSGAQQAGDAAAAAAAAASGTADGGGKTVNSEQSSLSSTIAAITQPFLQNNQATPRASPAALLKKQGRKVLRGPRSIPNLRIHAGNRSASSGSGAGGAGAGGGGGRSGRPALPTLGLAFQNALGGPADGGLISPPLRSAGSNISAHVAVPFPVDPTPAPGRGNSGAASQPPQIALQHYGDSSSGSGATSGSPATRAAVLTEGDVWGALLGANEEGGDPTSPAARRKDLDLGLGLDLRGSTETRNPPLVVESDVSDGEASASEGPEVGDTSADSGGSLGFGSARRRRRLKALTATRTGSDGLSPDGNGDSGVSPIPKLQHIPAEDQVGVAPPHRSASIGRGHWRSISPFGPSVVVKQANLRKVASSGLRNVRAGLHDPTSAPPMLGEGRNRLFPSTAASVSSHTPSSPDMSDGATPNVAGSQTPRIQPQLREAPSFTSSSGSHRTARGTGSDAHTLIFGSDGPTDLQGLGEDAELVLQYPAESASRSNSPAIGGASSPDPLASERFPKAFLPFWERSKPDDPVLIFDVFQTYAQGDPADETDAKRLSLTTAPAAAETHKRNESVDSTGHGQSKTIPASPSAGTVQALDGSPHPSAPASERSSRHLSTSTTQSTGAAGASTLPTDDPRFAIWTVREPEQPPIVSIGAQAFVSQVHDAAAPVVSPKAPTTTSRFSVRPPATPETPGRERTRAFAQASPFAAAGVGDPSEMATPTAANSDQRRRQNRNSNLREDVLLPLDRPTLLAATKSRLVAELTSEIDSRMLTDFFFTYRLYMTPCELFRLLSLRFQWALGQPCSPHDEARRRIVRVRTYTVLKYWLNNLFEYDFLSDGALRSELTKWLNSLAKDPVLANRDADLAIIKSLKKTVRELKQRYSRSGVGGLLAGDPNVIASESAELRNLQAAISAQSTSPQLKEPDGNAVSSPKVQDDVDLVLAVDDKKEVDEQGEGGGAGESVPPSRVNSMIQTGRARSGSESLAPSWLEQRRASSSDQDEARPDLAVRPDLAAQPFLTAPFNDADDAAEAGVFVPVVGMYTEDEPLQPTLAIQPTPSVQNPLSKAISNTVTRLTKFGRALGNRSTLTVPFSSDSGASSNDQDQVELTDLLADPRQLQTFIDALRNSQAAAAAAATAAEIEKPMLEAMAEVTEPAGSARTSFLAAQAESESSQSDSTNLDNTPGLSDASQSTPASSVRHRDSASGESLLDSRRSSASALGLGLGLDSEQKTVDEAPAPLPPATGEALHRYTSNQTLRTLGSIDQPLGSGLAPAPTLRDFSNYAAAMDVPNVVQIDDIDLSSDEDDGVVRRALRRLPGARDLRTTNNVRDLSAAEARQSFDSFSMASGHGPVKAAYTSIPASLVGSQRSGSWQDGIGGGLAAPTYPDKIGTVTTELLDPDEALAGYELVKGFRLDEVESDEEEPGDVEAALRRLEGILDEEKQREKARRVERMFQESQARIAARERMSKRATVAILSEEGPIRDSILSKAPSRLESILDAPSSETSTATADAASVRLSTDAPVAPEINVPDSPISDEAEHDSLKVKIRTYAEQRSPFLRSRPPLSSPKGGRPPLPAGAAARAARPLTFAAVPGADLSRSLGRTTRQGRVLMTSKGAFAGAIGAAAGSGSAATGAGSSGAALTPSPRPALHLPVMHYSFLLNSAPETIAQQFTLIEAELFKAVTWDELVSGRWRERTLEALDWETFYQRAGRRKAECIATGMAYKEQAVDAIIARFNLMCGWVASEVVLTQGIEMRAKLLSKMIRIAWKCYEQHNHATLTQILVGLQFPAVERLHKTWARLPAKHRRIFKDLKTFTSPSRNFAYLRAATQVKVTELGLVELMMTTGMATSSTRNPFSLAPIGATPGASAGGTGAGKSKRAEAAIEGFIPFFGLFTSTLESAEALPTFVDPSAPSCPVDMDPKTGELRSLANPDAFDHLPPLPASIRLEPLVNLFKARALALTVKTIIAFQERAALYSFEADRNMYVKCLKVRALQGHQQLSLSSFVEP
ncbi:Guanine nucleotide exchange factor lte1 [Tilletia horrida]|nr:Guanine nucleotide exchange factor lte1 [Tilletia horrida]